MPFVPIIRTPFTDLTGVILTHQNFGHCREIEMKVINCLEAYGMEKGLNKCSDLVDDFKECFTKEKQNKRIMEMMQERKRQAKAGMDTPYLPEPRLDACQ